jgi:hypothetical protein
MKFQLLGLSVVLGILFSIGWTNVAAYGVLRITSPHNGQQVPVGNNVISGTSSSNATNNCTVSVVINDMKPYQQTTPTANKGPSDYSNWTFTVTPTYSTIKQGINKLTAKYSCPQNVNLTKTNSVNVAGVAAKGQPIPPTPSTILKLQAMHFHRLFLV